MNTDPQPGPETKSAERPAVPPPGAGFSRILLIDDLPECHDLFRHIMAEVNVRARQAGHAGPDGPSRQFWLDCASTGAEGVALVQRALHNEDRYAAAFVDVRLPSGVNGIETTLLLWQVDPDIQIVLTSAYADYSWTQIRERLGDSDNLVVLKKPFDIVEVVQLAHALSKKWLLGLESKRRLADLEQRVEQRTRQLRAANDKLLHEAAVLQATQDELRRAQKMEALGKLAGGVAHDFNNLLMVIRGNTELALLDAPKGEGRVPERLSQVMGAAERAATLTRHLLAFSRKQPMKPETLDLCEYLGRLVQMLRRILREDIHLELHLPPALPLVRADPSMMEQVLVNLVINARDAMPQGGNLTISAAPIRIEAAEILSRPKARSGHFVMLTVADTGCGISAEHLPRLFEPFFTTKDVGKGTGLGLATVYGIIEQHQGWIEVESSTGTGSTFKLFLPSSHPPPLSPSALAPEVNLPAGRGETILLVEDEVLVRLVIRQALERFGYRVRESDSGHAALELWRESPGGFNLLLTDVIMPGGMNGHQLAERLRAEQPSLKVVFLSGYSGDMVAQVSRGFFLPKPCSWSELLTTVRRCLDEP